MQWEAMVAVGETVVRFGCGSPDDEQNATMANFPTVQSQLATTAADNGPKSEEQFQNAQAQNGPRRPRSGRSPRNVDTGARTPDPDSIVGECPSPRGEPARSESISV